MKPLRLTNLKINAPQINSASSLLDLEGRVFVCCDDQYCLYELQNGKEWVQHNWTEAPPLPADYLERKKLKPDFEALLSSAEDKNKLLLIPSGSKSNRTLALEFDLCTHAFRPLDLGYFFQQLGNRLEQTNLEGAVLYQDKYLFLNRGVESSPSSIVVVDAKTFSILEVRPIEFGELAGVALHGSELCLFEGALYTLAVAENTKNSFDDGLVLGSALFRMNIDDFKIIDGWSLGPDLKTEGLCRFNGKWMVTTDPDGKGISQFFELDEDL